MKTVVRGLVALALFIVGSAAHGVTYAATNRTLNGQPAGSALTDIANVSSRYGTSLKDAGSNFAVTIKGGNGGAATPEPGTGPLIATGPLWTFALVRQPSACHLCSRLIEGASPIGKSLKTTQAEVAFLMRWRHGETL